MSGTNKLLISEDTIEGEGYDKIAKDLLDANNEAIRELGETPKKEKTEREDE